ncbi:hypothetical protein C8J56DRAFT_896417 [Mycena floridula]|nr:hypothetical protein C8J56DRAFT_896417 [Mycena floridula]
MIIELTRDTDSKVARNQHQRPREDNARTKAAQGRQSSVRPKESVSGPNPIIKSGLLISHRAPPQHTHGTCGKSCLSSELGTPDAPLLRLSSASIELRSGRKTKARESIFEMRKVDRSAASDSGNLKSADAACAIAASPSLTMRGFYKIEFSGFHCHCDDDVCMVGVQGMGVVLQWEGIGKGQSHLRDGVISAELCFAELCCMTLGT